MKLLILLALTSIVVWNGKSICAKDIETDYEVDIEADVELDPEIESRQLKTTESASELESKPANPKQVQVSPDALQGLTTASQDGETKPQNKTTPSSKEAQEVGRKSKSFPFLLAILVAAMLLLLLTTLGLFVVAAFKSEGPARKYAREPKTQVREVRLGKVEKGQKVTRVQTPKGGAVKRSPKEGAVKNSPKAGVLVGSPTGVASPKTGVSVASPVGVASARSPKKASAHAQKGSPAHSQDKVAQPPSKEGKSAEVYDKMFGSPSADSRRLALDVEDLDSPKSLDSKEMSF